MPVYAGSVNREAALRVRVSRAAEDNTISRIIRLVEEAQEARAPTERFIDRFSRIYMPRHRRRSALLVALVPPLFFGGEWSVWIYRALAAAADRLPLRAGHLGAGGHRRFALGRRAPAAC